LRIERGQFFHEVYRIQQQLGRAYRETVPYPLFPIDEYFGGTEREKPAPILSELPKRSFYQAGLLAFPLEAASLAFSGASIESPDPGSSRELAGPVFSVSSGASGQ
jgi:hypothetical protein